MSLAFYARNARSADRARQRMQREGVTMSGAKLWTEEENAVLQQHFPNYEIMMQALPHRTRTAIRFRCGKLGLTRPKHVWMASEISLLRRLYARASKQEIMAALPGRSWISIKSAAEYYRFRRERKPYATIGVDALDALRQKCFECNMYMRDLDEIVGSKGYFRKALWRANGRVDFRRVGRAIEALGGKVTAEWPEENN
ncbi:hypothetical protein [Sinorhizobium meliloti]|uniref:hypothetical protein n=1 Tax=Rhizobium meliloti TaxID=382 RepID=UPI000FDC4637|nr:hypothetical protein [Sinorhizobium meliloti]RVK40917.1 hypothetical protein CN163_08505 [Sinorhizobium meliloti]